MSDRSSMPTICIVIPNLHVPRFTNLNLVMLSAWSKPERNFQNDLQNGLPSPNTKGGKSFQDHMAGELGFEPRFSESESDVLPLNYSPTGLGAQWPAGSHQEA